MPNIVGMELEQAQGTLQSSGVINPNAIGYFGAWPITVQWENGAGKGIVLSQNPASGTPVAANAPITLTCSSFPIGVVYP